MAQNLRKFSTYNEYSAATLVRPAVSWVSGTDEVYFDDIIPTPTCQPTNPNVWVTVDPSNFDFSQKVYQLDLSIANNLPYSEGVSLGLYNSPSDSNFAYKIDVVKNINPDDGTTSFAVTIIDSSDQIVYEGDDTLMDLCEILGSGFYLKASDVPSVEACDQTECTEYECLNWDEETGECIEQGECISTECVQSHTEYSSVVV